MYETIILGIACLSAPLFAKLAGYEISKKPYDLVGVGGLFFLLGAAFSLGPSRVDFMANIGAIGSLVSHVLGWALVIVGAFRGALDVLMEREIAPPRHKITPVLQVYGGTESKPPVGRPHPQSVKPNGRNAVKGHHR